MMPPPFRKWFSSHTLFPFELVYQHTKSPQSELPDHLHDWYEIVYVYGGKGTFFIDSQFYEMNPGDLFVIPGNTIHRGFPDSSDPVTSTAVFFARSLTQPESLGESYSALRCFDDARKYKHYKIQTTRALQEDTEETLAEIHSEVLARKPGYRHAVRLLLQRLLLGLNRQSVPEQQLSGTHVDARVGPIWLRETLHEIDPHPERDAGLSALASRAAVSSAHFSRTFKQWTGMNVTDYVNAKRIVRAKELLLEAECSVVQAAELCGFESLPHFHRTFKKITGATPGQYKRRNANFRP
jgi:AraC-like DNA-binding protein